VADPGGDWLDLARIDDLLFKPPGWKADWSIRLLGVDVGAVRTDSAASRTPGFVSVVGTWRDESIEVEAQSPEIPDREPSPDWTEPPCRPPPGGWRHGVAVGNLHFHIGDLESSGAMVTRVIFRPSADQEVLVVAATDIDAVIRQLSPKLPNQLCVVPSRFTRDQLNDVGDVLHAHWREWRLESSAPVAQTNRPNRSPPPNHSGSPPRWPNGPTRCPTDCSASTRRSAPPENRATIGSSARPSSAPNAANPCVFEDA
jgi:hypothetical protein